MAIIKAISTNGQPSLKKIIEYVQKENKSNSELMTGINCSVQCCYDEMMITKQVYNKLNGVQYKHYVQSFHRDENITPEQAHEIAIELINKNPKFRGHEILLSTHIDKEHIHTHIIINSVNAETGIKFHEKSTELKNLKKLSDEILTEHGLTICEKGKTFNQDERTAPTSWNKYEYKTLIQADEHITTLQEQGRKLEQTESWKYNIALAVELARQEAESMEQFIQLLDADDINVAPEGKYITFIDWHRKQAGEKKYKIRDKTLNKNFNITINKEVLINGFEINKQRKLQQRQSIIRRTTGTAQQLATSAQRSIDAINRERQYNKLSAEPIREININSTSTGKIIDRTERANKIIEQRKREIIETGRESETATRQEQQTRTGNTDTTNKPDNTKEAKRNFAKYYYGNNR